LDRKLSKPVVLIFTHWFDPTADHVVTVLTRRGVDVARFDAADFPADLFVTSSLDDQWDVRLNFKDRTVNLADVRGGYYRRPTSFDCRLDDRSEQEWAKAEARAGLGGLLLAAVRWMNHPHHSGYANYRAIQLMAARRAGLLVPPTVITSCPAQARAFAAEQGEVIYKPMTHVSPGRGQVLYAVPVTVRDLDGDGGEAISGTMHLLQRRIRADYAVRLTAVDGRMFAAAIFAHSDAAAVDWRADYDSLTYEPVETPPDVAVRVRTMMSQLGLRFGALDFLVTPDGMWHFLEINPNGQWAWIEQETGLRISEAIADSLLACEQIL
jgi:ATP-grasp ribosomal peptide maturase